MGAAIWSSAFIGAASKLITMDLRAVRLLEPFVFFAKQDSKIDARRADLPTRRRLEDQFEKDSPYIDDVPGLAC